MWTSAELLGEVSATSLYTLPAGKVIGQFVTIALRCVFGTGLICHSLSVGYNAAIGDSPHLRRDIEDSRSNGHGNSVLTRTIVRCVCGTLTSCWNTVDDGDAVFVVRWILMTLVANADVAIEEGKFEGFVLSAFEYTIRRFETIE